ncbi:hypothetical protein JW796_04675 [Candidatus Dojkabacteria bacterium]|nr:hypothetical protein [Candidatus Dojkabacteria bacterium]
MKKKYAVAALVSVTTFLALIFGLPTSASAQTSLIPNFIRDIFGEASNDPANYVTARVRLGIIIALGIVILVAVVFSILAAIKYISSQGEEGKVTEAKKSVTAILTGVAVLFIAIIGIALVLVFFNVSTPVTEVYNFCITDPDKASCQSCTNGVDANSTACINECRRLDEDKQVNTVVTQCGNYTRVQP